MVRPRTTQGRFAEVQVQRTEDEPSDNGNEIANARSDAVGSSRRKSIRKAPTRMRQAGNFKMSKNIWKDIIILRSQTGNCIPVEPFQRVVKELLMKYAGTEMEIEKEALAALHESAELYMTQYLRGSYLRADVSLD